jgi:23S rRNA (guanosine2251-2'-O)-methyltransferase
MGDTLVILHNIRSTHNVGSIFRTSECAGVEKIYLTGYTPSPIDRFGRKRKDISKVSLGAEKMVEWESGKEIIRLIVHLKEEGYKVIAVEQDKKATDYKHLDVRRPSGVVFVFGNEVDGLEKGVLNACDEIIEIPMKGRKKSLNVSVVAGIILFYSKYSNLC